MKASIIHHDMIDVTAHLDFLQRWFSGFVNVNASQPKQGMIALPDGRHCIFRWATLQEVDDPEIDVRLFYPVALLMDGNTIVQQWLLNSDWMRSTKNFLDRGDIASYVDILNHTGRSMTREDVKDTSLLPLTTFSLMERNAKILLVALRERGMVRDYERYQGMGRVDSAGSINLLYEAQDGSIDFERVPARLLLHPEEHTSYIDARYAEYVRRKEAEAERVRKAQEEADRKKYEELRKKFEQQ